MLEALALAQLPGSHPEASAGPEMSKVVSSYARDEDFGNIWELAACLSPYNLTMWSGTA